MDSVKEIGELMSGLYWRGFFLGLSVGIAIGSIVAILPRL